MAVRFHCEKCSYQIVLESTNPAEVTCPSCKVALLPLAEATGITVPPLPALPVQTTPALLPKPIAAPPNPFKRLAARKGNPLLMYAGAVGGAVVVALLVVGVVFGTIIVSKQRERAARTAALQNLKQLSLETGHTHNVEVPLPPPPQQPQGPRWFELVLPHVEQENHTVLLPPVEKPEPPTKPDMKEPLPVVKPVREFKRRDRSSEEDLRKQLVLAPEVSLDTVPQSSVYLQNLARGMTKSDIQFQGPAVLLSRRPDLQGLPLRMGVDCQLGKEPAENMQVLSRKMRVVLEKSIPKDGIDSRPDARQLREALLNDARADWLQAEAVPCLLQLLQAENSPVRKVLVEVLGKIKDRRATEALAMRSMMDLNPDVREAAARELLDRPCEEYEPLLLAGLRYPWAPVATHAAETLAFVKDTGAVAHLVKVLDQPDATMPFTVRQGTKETTYIREVVRINHLGNCLLCHPPSFARTDLVRGAVPTPGQALPAPATSAQYYESGSIFVHADMTYLKQDFSVMQPVPKHGEWPSYQRFDYLVRTRRPTTQELQFLAQKRPDRTKSESHQAALFALREITGKDLGQTALDWKPLVEPKMLVQAGAAKLEEKVGADWRQFVVVANSEPDLSNETDAKRLKKELLAAPREEQAKMLTQLRDAQGLPYTDALVEVIGELGEPMQTRARDMLAERLARMTDTTLRDRLAEEERELRRAAARAAGLKKSKALIPELLPLLDERDADMVQAARQSLKALTEQDFGPQPEADRAGRDKAAAEWRAWWKKQTGT